MDPGTAAIVASTLSALAGGAVSGLGSAQKKKAAKFRSREMKRETYADLLNEALQRNAELHTHEASQRMRKGKASTENMMNTASILREAFNI